MSQGSSQFVEFIVEQLAEVAGITKVRFFGGTGLAAHSTQFAMIMGTSVYFVVDKVTRPKYEKLGSKCFAYDTKVKRVQVRKYFEVPAEIIEDREALVSLAREAVHVAHSLKKSVGKSDA